MLLSNNVEKWVVFSCVVHVLTIWSLLFVKCDSLSSQNSTNNCCKLDNTCHTKVLTLGIKKSDSRNNEIEQENNGVDFCVVHISIKWVTFLARTSRLSICLWLTTQQTMLFKDINKCQMRNPNYVYDEACLDILNGINDTVKVVGQYSECHQCDFQDLTTVGPLQNTSILVNTRYPLQLYYVIESTKQCRYVMLHRFHSLLSEMKLL